MHCSKNIRATGLRPLNATLAALAILMLALVVGVIAFPASAEPGNDNRTPDVGEYTQLNVEAGHKVAFHAYAEGVQIYKWNGTGWDFVGPEAVLFSDDTADTIVGIHYAGPTWESNSGSKVVGAVAERATVDADAIPWLKLKATSSQGPGIFNGITWIQRVNTVGGKAPSEAGEFVGQQVSVPYAADYYFYRKAGK